MCIYFFFEISNSDAYFKKISLMNTITKHRVWPVSEADRWLLTASQIRSVHLHSNTMGYVDTWQHVCLTSATYPVNEYGSKHHRSLSVRVYVCMCAQGGVTPQTPGYLNNIRDTTGDPLLTPLSNRTVQIIKSPLRPLHLGRAE